MSWNVWPNRSGLLAASETPRANVNAARMPSTPATAPTSAGRTGTEVRPRPGSRAKRAPMTTGTGNPARAAALPTPERRLVAVGRDVPRASHPETAATPATRRITQARPGPSTVQSTLTPGDDSNSAAVPSGNHCDATIAPAEPIIAPASPAHATPA